MSWPQRLWWLSIYLATVLSLLAHGNNASEASTETPTSTNTPKSDADAAAEENYETIDVAQRGSEGNQQIQTGQTTRIFTTGDVDDKFWLKHLGEDFKYAIHLQVEENDGVYNMTEDGANYEVQQDYQNKENPVNNKNNRNQKESETTNDETLNFSNSNATYKQNEVENYGNELRNGGSNGVYNETSSSSSFPIQQNNDAYEKVFAIDGEGATLMKKLHNQYIDSPKVQNINIRYTQKPKTSQTKDTTNKDNTEVSSKPWNSPASPVVVTLPEDDKTIHHFADENTPVVVKMPPVIYHHNFNYDQQDQLTNSEIQPYSNSEQNQYTQSQQQQQQQYNPTDYTSYNQHTPISPPPVPSQSYYTPTLIEDQTSYNRNSVYSAPIATPNTPLNPNPREHLQKSTDSIRFILRKPSTPYNGSPIRN